MATILLAHGAWNGGWGWKKMRPLFAGAGHAFWTPTYTGLGERRHLAHRDIDLDTHIADLVGVIEDEELSDVVLLAHSYGGMVATGVADRARDRVQRIIYVDAIVPRDGQAVNDIMPTLRVPVPDAETDWLIEPSPLSPDNTPGDSEWLMRHRSPHPAKCFSQKIRLSAEPSCPRHYIYALQYGPVDRFGPFRDRAREENGWTLHTIDSTHSPNVTAPWALFGIVQDILSRG
jgi:pimeloyl-ACP methyl ester carboxylesterase